MQNTQRTWTRRLIVLIVTGGVLGAGLGFVASAVIVAGYDASAFLLVTPSGPTPVQTNEVQYAQAISQVVNNPSVLGAADNDAELPDDPQKVRADPSPNAPLIELIVTADDADTARRQAQAAADAVVAYTGQWDDMLGFHAVILAPATRGEPAGLSLAAYLVAGAAMGAVLGGLGALLGGERVAAPEQTWTTHADNDVAPHPPATPARSS